ncbi:AAA family ATPase [Succinivibrio dextrinosolvens]|uniref:AAA family ATPase n=1 Tax=Succinivibrio dextrinosolvens TaxID=83771 RepID=UPI0004E143C2|nr:AAA family ATPase [Succinivibrio dextrinosolvens]
MKDIKFNTGSEDFEEIIDGGAYYVDKTAYLKNILLSSSEVKNSLFIRPRRFGKTLNLSMIKEFCKLNYQNPEDKSYQHKLFVDNGRNLAVAGDDYREFREKIMGEFPVISVSFKTVEGGCFQQAVSQLLYKFGLLYHEFLFLNKSSKQTTSDLDDFNKNYNFCTTKYDDLDDPVVFNKAISIIGKTIPKIGAMLYQEFGRKVIVIIDEYDVPLQKAVIAEEPYYNKMLEIIRTISGNTFKKDNLPWLYKGIVSGCLRIAHQSVFTDANNFTTYGMNREPFTQFYGFTEAETQKLLSDCGLSDKESTVKEWYDGYRFGKNHIFCPWSLISYCDEVLHGYNDKPQPFWINTSGNDLITMFTKNSMEAHDAGNLSKLQQLLDGESVDITLEEFTTYPDIRNRVSFDIFMTLMLHTGYVTYSENSDFTEEVTIRIPNQEVLSCFRAKQKFLYGENNPYWFNQAMTLVVLLLENRTDEAQDLINSMLMSFLSVRNTRSELYYHGFMVGVLGFACASKGIDFHEEIEKGDGFPDVVLKKKSSRTVTVLEFKKGNSDLPALMESADSAAAQIIEKKYAEPYIRAGYTKVYGIGIGFGGKDCVAKTLGNLAQKK